MNIAEAKQIDIALVAHAIGAQYCFTRGNDQWHKSPWRQDSSPSFITHHGSNRYNKYNDFGTGYGLGSTIDLMIDNKAEITGQRIDRHDSMAISSALKELDDLNLAPRIYTMPRSIEINAPSPTYKILKRQDRITDRNIKDELDYRQITPRIIAPYIEQVTVYNTKRKTQFNALAFDNNNHFKCAPFVRGDKSYHGQAGGGKQPAILRRPKAEVVMIHDGMHDFSAWMQVKQGDEEGMEHIVLQSDGNARAVGEYLRTRPNTGMVITLMGKDQSGRKAEALINDYCTEMDVKCGSLSELIYDEGDDFSDQLRKYGQELRKEIRKNSAEPKYGNYSAQPGNAPKLRY